MSQNAITTWVTVYRAGVVLGLGAIIWLFSQFVTKEAFGAYREAHKEYGDSQLKRIDGDLDDIKNIAKSIDAKLDRLLEAK